MSRKLDRDVLTGAIKAVDLPGLIVEHYPESRCKPGKAGVFFASWRGNKDTPALSLSLKDGVWLWHDMAEGEGGNAFDFLVNVVGMSRQEAAWDIMERTGIPTDAGESSGAFAPIPREASDHLLALPVGQRVSSMSGRGFSAKMLGVYGITSDDGKDALIPITSPEGVVMQVKRRLFEVGPAGKYRYEHKGLGAPAWCSPGSRLTPTILMVEGELSAIIAHATLIEHGHTDIGVMGLPGAGTSPYPGLLKGKRVLIYADDDEAGAKARKAWADAARDEGARSVHAMKPNSIDFCDQAGKYGREALMDLLDALMISATQVYGAADRMLGSISVKELIESTRRYFHGGVIHPTGFGELDQRSGGIRETGLYGIAGLSGAGKSSLMRRFLTEHVRQGGRVKLYSPDQSPKAVYRLLAAQLSGVGLLEARTGTYGSLALKLHGSPNDAMAALEKTFEHIAYELSERFQVSEESDLKTIVSDARRAREAGTTMFAVDYIQMLRPAGQDKSDGQQAKELQALSAELGVPILATMQLAKYKFPVDRKDASPNLNDIEGSGSYVQSSEMIFMIHNEGIYRRKYGGPNTLYFGDPDGDGRVKVAKDKEGDGDYTVIVTWEPSLATYRDPSVYDLKRERKGLIDG